MKIAILLPNSACEDADAVKQHYLDKLQGDVTIIPLQVSSKGKVSSTLLKDCLPDLLAQIKDMDYVLAAQGDYFKKLAGVSKAGSFKNTICDSKLGNFKVVLTYNYRASFYNIEILNQINESIETVLNDSIGVDTSIGKDIIHYANYPDTLEDIEHLLNELHKFPVLAVDIEAFGLDFHSCGIGSITFCWTQHRGIAFLVDYKAKDGVFHSRIDNKPVKKLLKAFFESYEGECVYHGVTYDTRVLVYELFMDHLSDYKGCIDGIEVITKATHCTQSIYYLCTNNAYENTLGLKHAAYDFAGNWGEDVKDISLLPVNKLLRYNLVDGLSTMYLFEKHLPSLFEERLMKTYQLLHRDRLSHTLTKEINGLCVDIDRVLEVEKILLDKLEPIKQFLNDSPIIKDLEANLQVEAWQTKQASLKVKKVFLEDFNDRYNPNSGKQTIQLLHDVLKLPIRDVTKTNLPSVGGDTLQKHINLLKSEFGITDG